MREFQDINGTMNELRVTAIEHQGVWLQAGRERIFMPLREAPVNVQVGSILNVFVYIDMQGVPVATLRRPTALVGEFAYLKVVKVGPNGAFLDWGLQKNLLVPFKEQPEPMQTGRSYVVKVRLDRQGRPLGTGRIDKCLSNADIDVVVGERVDLLVWRFTPLGANVIVNHRYSGLLYRDEIGNRLNVGDHLAGYIKRIRHDHKIDVTLRIAAGTEIDAAKEKILAALARHGGALALHDHTSPAHIEAELGMSKKLFKKTVGGLYKAGLITLSDQGIALKKKNS